MAEHIFVYGTLRPALAHGAMLELVTRLERVGLATLPGQLYDLGPYPAATLNEAEAGVIVGEVYRLPDHADVLARLDEHEEYRADDLAGSMYLRVRRAVRLDDGQSMYVWVYAYNRSVAGARLVPGGDYVAWKDG